MRKAVGVHGIEIQDVRINAEPTSPNMNEKAVSFTHAGGAGNVPGQAISGGRCGRGAQKIKSKPKRTGKLSLPRLHRESEELRWRRCQSVQKSARTRTSQDPHFIRVHAD